MAKFTVTLKAGAGYDAPWVIIKANSATELDEAMADFHMHYMEQKVARSSRALKAGYAHPDGV